MNTPTPSPYTTSLAARLTGAPVAARAKTKSRLVDLGDALSGVNAVANGSAVRALLARIAEHSPYLWSLALADPVRLAQMLEGAPEEGFALCLASLQSVAPDDETALHMLRRCKQHGHLLIALCDLGGLWTVDQVMTAVTQLADAATQAATQHALRAAAAAGRLTLYDDMQPEHGCGLVLLALGKHGAGELNYSSDIDLVALFDAETPALADRFEATRIYVRIVQHIARLLQEHTGDGYAFRVDLRLRPDPGSTPVAVSLTAAMSYYELLGQNWERAAFIKARPVAGDVAMGAAFLEELTPFLWRRYFDYAAIADIHAMKRQIHAVRGFGEIAVAGHNIKVGRGGIREIEFFVQTQQLIFGGRRPHLRGSRTLDMLRALAADGWITGEAVDELSAAYRFLRMVEHRLQMVADEQTQRLPSEKAELENIARFCGWPNTKAFGQSLLAQLACVERHYARLFETEPELASSVGNLVFTGADDDAETLQTLSRMGFAQPALAAETVRGWHYGRRPAMQSARAREVLTALVPALLEAFAGSGDADAALLGFDAALGRMPAAVELFAILRSNEKLRQLFADILGGAPRLARIVALHPHLLDAAIDPAQAPHVERRVRTRAQQILDSSADSETFMDACRDLAQEEAFLVAVRYLAGVLSADEAGHAYSAIADAMVEAALDHAIRNVAATHGIVRGGRCAVVAMGRLGSREMTASSDLDLILIYDFDDDTPDSNGARPLHAVQYYARLTKRLVNLLTSATRRGKLYDVDLRLRPSGGQGPVATRLAAFVTYQADEAETWEHMALTRARPIAGDAGLSEAVDAACRGVVARRRDRASLRKDVAAMRGLVAREKGEDAPWDLKLAAGGMLDLEFMAQFLVLAHAAETSAIIERSTVDVLRKAREAGLIDNDDAETLIAACNLYQAVTQITRIAVDGQFDPARVASSVARRIAIVAGLPDFTRVESELGSMRVAVRRIFVRHVGHVQSGQIRRSRES